MLGDWGESGTIGSGISVAAMSDRFWRAQIVSHWLRIELQLQEVSC